MIKTRFPDAKVGFPGLSQGELLPGWRADDAQFLNEAVSAVQKSDWVGVNCYWTDQASLRARNKGRVFEVYRDKFPDKLLIITEFCNPIQGVTGRTKARQYLEFYRMVRSQPQHLLSLYQRIEGMMRLRGVQKHQTGVISRS